jgi:folate-dependent phosphoribosylglycinamide formyltransferase PurN
MLKIGWFSTGRGEGSRGLLRFVQERILRGRLDSRVEFVFSNRDPGEAEGSDQFFQLVQGYGIPLVTLSSTGFRRARGRPFSSLREEYDQQAMSLLSEYHPDLCVLAGYMLIVGSAMCRKYPLLNLHPALPDGPTGTWQEVIWSLIQARATRTGAMVHLATEDVDRGPVLSHCTVSIVGGAFAPHWKEMQGQDLSRVKAEAGEELPLFQLIRRVEYQREPYLLFETLRAIGEGEAAVQEGGMLDRRSRTRLGAGAWGLCLDREIDRAMAEDGLLGRD